MKAMQHSWGSLSALAQDRQKWRDFVAALDTKGCNGLGCINRSGINISSFVSIIIVEIIRDKV